MVELALESVVRAGATRMMTLKLDTPYQFLCSALFACWLVTFAVEGTTPLDGVDWVLGQIGFGQVEWTGAVAGWIAQRQDAIGSAAILITLISMILLAEPPVQRARASSTALLGICLISQTHSFGWALAAPTVFLVVLVVLRARQLKNDIFESFAFILFNLIFAGVMLFAPLFWMLAEEPAPSEGRGGSGRPIHIVVDSSDGPTGALRL